MADIEADGDVYVYRAPEEPPVPPSDETGEIVGAIVACVVIIGVLVFLWKMLERKRADMADFHDDPEEGSSDGEIPTSPKSDPASPKRSFLPSLLQVKRESEFTTAQLPNVVSDESKEDPEPVRALEELILPNLTPITSSVWSRRGEDGSGDTGYVSGFCRKEPILRRRFKHSCFDAIELDVEHPRDIMYSLKHDNEALLQEMEQRRIKSKDAISEIGDCLQLVHSAREKVSSSRTKKRKENEEVKKFLREARETRWKHELHRKMSFHYSYVKQQTKVQRDAFFSMQEWFDGLTLRSELRCIAEEIFLLRSQHLSAFDRNECEKELIKESLTQIEKCQSEISNTKSLVNEMRQQLAASRQAREATGSAEQEKEPTTEVRKTAEKSKVSRFRIKLPLLRDKLAPSDGFAKSDKRDQGERCATCRQLVCKCAVTNSGKSNEQAHSSNDVNVAKIMTSKPKTVAPEPRDHRANPQEHSLTLKLIEVTAKESSDDGVPELSEREVRKALNRVPFVTSVREVAKGLSNDEWILQVVSAQPRLANVRFNCRGRTYVIGMVGDVKI